MPKYRLFHIIDASSTEDVEADSPEEALELAENDSPRECASCTDFELADCIKTIVSDEDGNEIYETKTFTEEQLEREQDAHQKTRRRLLVKLLRERGRHNSLRNEDGWVRRPCVWFWTTADAIESNKPLTYFEQLADTCDSSGELKRGDRQTCPNDV